ncbi:MAG: hypothetical protein ACTHW1_02910 [Ancrocorticia sp.]|uniref:hypothetical protein n=1 Tax=Ancrocorticia sp. TaxID=2593684 RepID=UPI003F8EC087
MEKQRSFPETRRGSLAILLSGLLGLILLAFGMGWAAQTRTGLSDDLLDSFGERLVVLLIALALIQLFCAWHVPRLLELPHENAARVWLIIVSVGALGAVSLGTLEQLAVIAALAVPVIFMGEMFRPGSRDHLLWQVSGTYAGAVLAVMNSMWFLVARSGAASVALVCVAAMCGALLISLVLVGRTRLIAVPLGALIGGFAAQFWLGTLPGWITPAFALALALIMWGLDYLARSVGLRDNRGAKAALGLIPISAMGVVGYALSLLVL